jgi:hypothetical protein
VAEKTATQPRDEFNSQLEENQRRLQQDNAAQMGAQSGVDAISGAQPNNSKAWWPNYSETDDGTWASERNKGVGVQTGRGLAEDLGTRTGGRNYMYEPDTATQTQNPGGGLLGGLLGAQNAGTHPSAYSPTGSPTAAGAGGGAAAPAAPTVDTSATAPDPYQALIDQYAKSSGQTIEEATKAIDDIIAQLQGNLPNANGGRVDRVNTTEQENLLAQIVAAQQEQAKRRNDYAVQQGVDQLNRAMEDAAPQFQTMRNQAAAAEAQALDNQALYAEARGDRGGIGAAQYASIQNTAAQNQLTVNREQTKLATDTARQIADLRAQGEFKKADELLSITQSYLSELMQLKQWADQANISIDEFNAGVQQWEQEYNAKIQQALAGMKMDAAQWSAGQNLDNDRDILNMTLSNMQQQENKNAKVAEQMIAAGITPTDQQLQAIGWNKDQYAAYKAAMAMAAAAGAGGGTKGNELYRQVQTLISGGVKNEIINDYIKNNSLSGLYSAEDIKATNGLWSGAQKNKYQGKADYDVGG